MTCNPHASLLREMLRHACPSLLYTLYILHFTSTSYTYCLVCRPISLLCGKQSGIKTDIMRSQSEGCFELHQGSWIASVAKLQHIAYMSRAMSLSWQYSNVYSEWGVGIYCCPSPSLSHVQVSQTNYYQVALAIRCFSSFVRRIEEGEGRFKFCP